MLLTGAGGGMAIASAGTAKISPKVSAAVRFMLSPLFIII